MSVPLTAVHIVCIWPLKRRGLRWHGGVVCLQRSRKDCEFVPSVVRSVVWPLGSSLLVVEESSGMGIVRSAASKWTFA